MKPDQQRACFHFTNLRPLWAIDNLRKGARVLTDRGSWTDILRTRQVPKCPNLVISDDT